METLLTEDQNKLPHNKHPDGSNHPDNAKLPDDHERFAYQAYKASRADLVRWAAHKLDGGEAVSEGVLRVLIARQIETTLAMGFIVSQKDESPLDSEEGVYRDVAEIQRDIQSRIGLFVPKGEISDGALVLHGIPDGDADPSMDLGANILMKYPKGLDDEYSILTLLVDGIAVEEPGACKRIIQDVLHSNIADLDHEVLEALLHGLLKSQEPHASMDLLCRFLCEKRGDHITAETQQIIVELIAYMKQDVFEKYVFALIASNMTEDDKRYIIQVLLSVRNFADVLNAVRAVVVRSHESDPLTAQGAEAMGRMLVGKDADVPFLTSLQQVYEAIRFEEYQPNVASTDQDVTSLEGVLRTCQIKPDDTLVEFGSGTGGLMRELVNKGYTDVVGIEESEKNVQTAKQYTQYDQTSRIVHASWYETGLQADTVDCIYSLGRSLPHVENKEGFQEMLREAHRILCTGGVFCFDMPDSESEHYATLINEHSDRVHSLCGDSEVSRDILGYCTVSSDDTVIDSPDGVHWYNRYIPSATDIRSMCEREGFELVSVETKEIQGIRGAREHLFVFRKRPPESIDDILGRLATLASIVPASNVQSAGGE